MPINVIHIRNQLLLLTQETAAELSDRDLLILHATLRVADSVLDRERADRLIAARRVGRHEEETE